MLSFRACAVFAFAPDTPCLSLALQKGSKGFLVFLYPLSIMCPNCACMQLFLVLYSLCFVAEERYVQVPAVQERVLGLSLSQGGFHSAADSSLEEVVSDSLVLMAEWV